MAIILYIYIYVLAGLGLYQDHIQVVDAPLASNFTRIGHTYTLKHYHIELVDSSRDGPDTPLLLLM